MAKLRDVCRHVRSKNAGPFWITVDLFFVTPELFRRYADSPSLSGETFARLYGTKAALVKHIPVEQLAMVKISYPRSVPQGSAFERDMHGGQQFVRLLDIELDH